MIWRRTIQQSTNFRLPGTYILVVSKNNQNTPKETNKTHDSLWHVFLYCFPFQAVVCKYLRGSLCRSNEPAPNWIAQDLLFWQIVSCHQSSQLNFRRSQGPVTRKDWEGLLAESLWCEIQVWVQAFKLKKEFKIHCKFKNIQIPILRLKVNLRNHNL